MEEDKNKVRWFPYNDLGVGFFLVAFVLIGGAFLWGMILHFNSLSGEIETGNAAQMGDFIGGLLNPILSSFALLALIYTNYLQRKDLDAQREIAKGQLNHLQSEANLKHIISVYEETLKTINELLSMQTDMKKGRVDWCLAQDGIEFTPKSHRVRITNVARDIMFEQVRHSVLEEYVDKGLPIIAGTPVYNSLKKNLEVLLNCVLGIFEILEGHQLLRAYRDELSPVLAGSSMVLIAAKKEFEAQEKKLSMEEKQSESMKRGLQHVRTEKDEAISYQKFIGGVAAHIYAKVEDLTDYKKEFVRKGFNKIDFGDLFPD